MSLELQTFKQIVIVGLGKTGFSCAKFLHQQGFSFIVNDSREHPPYLDEIKLWMDESRLVLGEFNRDVLLSADLIILSQGVSLHHPVIHEAYLAGICFINDVDLFSQVVKAPFIAITGSNAKSTVTTLVGEILSNAGFTVEVGGNLGTPLLTLLENPIPDYYVLELSNFQLELSHDLHAQIACILNITPDHMDSYDTFEAYVQAKQRIYADAEYAIYNLDDSTTYPPVGIPSDTFAYSQDSGATFTLIDLSDGLHLAKKGVSFLPMSSMKLKGIHHALNGLAAAAIADKLSVPFSVISDTIRHFSGLPHRCQWTAEVDGVLWINDSKGTNTGATIAAIEGLGRSSTGKIILIAGGQGKGADFSTLAPAVEQYVKQVILLGQDAVLLAQALNSVAPCERVDSLENAILTAAKVATAGDVVLFSPACASFDMFKNFEHRGELFMHYVKELIVHGKDECLIVSQ
jgi:UDP-N-acetylmuramoylalanine--D-glutamate ligase